MPRPSSITIDLSALAHNARLARSLAGRARIMAAVKADAYGHGLLPCSRVLASVVDGLAVAVTEEAIALREAGITVPLLIMEGPFDPDDCRLISRYQFATVIHSLEQLDMALGHDLAAQCDVWLKVDTGMHRLGLSPSEVDSALEKLQSAGDRHLVLMSHLAHAENSDSAITHRQLERWRRLTDSRSLSTSLMNSAGLIGRLPGDSDWMRPGYMLYGGRPSPKFDIVPLAPVMTFQSRVMAIREIAVGETVGYGGRWTAQRDSRIATIPVGYGDGYPRTAANGTPVWIEGHHCPLVGRVSMDMITVDVTDYPSLTTGSRVELWGRELSVDTVATHAGTIGYELLTRMPNRIKPLWVNG